MPGFKTVLAEIVRFAAAGLGNTILTIGIYQLSVSFVSPLLAYLAAWCVGIIIVTLLYPPLVFRRRASLTNAGVMAGVYVLALIIGSGVTVLSTKLHVPDRTIIIIAVAVTSSFTYLCGRRALI